VSEEGEEEMGLERRRKSREVIEERGKGEESG